ncbi:rRNA biogenesis protein rrp5 [Thelotrema lepadinum]|nr:rRNA biogenesis protein rrp5 [Thelotrema lepadinum]
MAPIKRKASLEPPTQEIKRSKLISQDHSKLTTISSEGDAFRRGGADVLTPLERRQIRTKAEQDALAEEGLEPQRAKLLNSGDDESVGDSDKELITTRTGRKRRRLMSKGASLAKEASAAKKPSIHVEGLSYKKLVPGFLVLGQISNISSQDITLSLPNNLVGFIPRESISQGIDLLSHSQDEAPALEEDDHRENLVSSPSIQDYFYVGQYLRAVVTSNTHSAGSRATGKKRIELSILPKHANTGLTTENITAKTTLQAEVVSVEDHGLVMNIGLSETGVKGFVSTKDLGSRNNLPEVKPGAVRLCLVLDVNAKSKFIKLSFDTERLANLQETLSSKNISTIDTLLPGALVEVTLAEITPYGLLGNLMGLVDFTADLVHSGHLLSDVPLDQKYRKGMKLKARTIWTLPSAETKTIGISILGHVLALSEPQTPGPKPNATPLDVLPISSIKDDCKVQKVQPSLGLLMDVGIPSVFAYAHISRLSDDKIRDISAESGKYAVGTLHQGRVVGYNPLDGLFSLSLEPKILSLPFLYLDNVQPGQKVKATVEKLLIHPKEASSVIVRLTDTITGLIPDAHFADVPLHVPERKFKLGSKIATRVLSVDLIRRRIRLTCKKTLINSDSPVWKTYSDLSPGMKSYGTIKSLKSSGAVLEFYGPVKGFLPVSEMSESLVRDPKEHFRVGQVLNVRVGSVDVARERLTLSCREPSSSEAADTSALESMKVGRNVVGKIAEKLPNDLVLEIEETNARAVLPIGHLLDASHQDCLNAAKRLRVGQTLKNVVVAGKGQDWRQLKLTRKPSISKAIEAEAFPALFEDINLDKNVVGYVKNITTLGVFVQFADSLTGLLLRSQIPDDRADLPDYGLERDQTIYARVISIDPDQQRFLLTQKKASTHDTNGTNTLPNSNKIQVLANAVDGVSKSLEDFVLGKTTKARIKSVKETQLNVELADGVSGRVDISQAFTSLADIKDRKRPLRSFKTGQVLPVHILGIHDSKNHRYLPITHSRTTPVFELSAKQESPVSDLPTLDKVQVGSSWLCFVNNIARDYLWVNISPSLRGKIHALDVSNDPSVLNNLLEHFPVGSAIRATVLNVDLSKSRLDLTGRAENIPAPRNPKELKKGAKVTVKVVSCTDMLVKVQLSVMSFGVIHITDVVDDFSEADMALYRENSYLTACVIDFDEESNRLSLSLRPSVINSSPLPVVDQAIESIGQLHIDQTLRGFIKNVTDKGIFVSLSRSLTAFVRVSDLSDSFLKHWQDRFKQYQLIKGKIVDIDPTLKQVRMSLKDSVIDKEYRVPIKWDDLREGEIRTGKVRKVEPFGVFVVFDNSLNVSGLCHRSEMADDPVTDARSFYQEGDAVKAKILNLEQNSRRVSLGMKASYLEQSTILGDENSGASDSSEDGDELAAESIEVSNAKPSLNTGVVNTASTQQGVELEIGDFEWTDTLDLQVNDQSKRLLSKHEANLKGKTAVEADFQDGLPLSHFEKLVMNQPGSSLLWLKYLSFHLQLGEVDKARDVAERAVRAVTSHSGDGGEETLDMWIGYLNMEHAYGDEVTLERVFERACQYNDPKEVHQRVASIYIKSGVHKVRTNCPLVVIAANVQQKADEILQNMVKKFSDDYKVWLNYASFLFNVAQAPDRGRELLSRALQSLAKTHHVQITSKFAQLEFKSSCGDSERGRTMFEGLFATFPQRLDLWTILIDLEASKGSKNQVRKLYERVTSGKLKVQKAKFFFKKWLEFEENEGDHQNVEMVKAKAARYVETREAAQERSQEVLLHPA